MIYMAERAAVPSPYRNPGDAAYSADMRKAAALGESKHNAIGRAPKKLLYVAAVIVAVLIYLWMKR